MNTANWIPDLFMKRVIEGGDWTLFSPSVPDLHDKWGRKFEEAYVRYEAQTARGELKLYKKIPAVQLWRKMLSMCCSRRAIRGSRSRTRAASARRSSTSAPHSSGTCAPRSRSTPARPRSPGATPARSTCSRSHEEDRQGNETWELDHTKLQQTIRTAMRMLDNVIDIKLRGAERATEPEASSGWPRHHGLQDCLHLTHTPYASETARRSADASMEAVCYYAYWASTELAAERGRYSTYKGSLWERGILPQDTLKLLRTSARGGYVDIDESATMDWEALLAHPHPRHAQLSCIAIAPTATISNIIGVGASIEPGVPEHLREVEPLRQVHRRQRSISSPS
jgi:ribonucleoside-diphosphate reductase alpha chain